MEKHVHIIAHSLHTNADHTRDTRSDYAKLLDACLRAASEQNVTIPPVCSYAYEYNYRVWFIAKGYAVKHIEKYLKVTASVDLEGDYKGIFVHLYPDVQRQSSILQERSFLYEDIFALIASRHKVAGIALPKICSEESFGKALARGFEALRGSGYQNRFPITTSKVATEVYQSETHTPQCFICRDRHPGETCFLANHSVNGSVELPVYVCSSCAETRYCRLTRRIVESLCRSCKCGPEFCSCPTCGCKKHKRLKKGHLYLKGVCNKCLKCRMHLCKCEFPGQRVFRPNKRLIAVEYEFGRHNDRNINAEARRASYGAFDGLPNHRIMTDTSAPIGVEAVIGPLPPKVAKEKLGAVLDWSKTWGLDQDLERGSLHVHVNALDLDMYDLRKFVTIWSKVEPEVLTTYIKRPPNNYSRPFYQFDELPEFIELLWSTENSREIRYILRCFLGTAWSPKEVLNKLEVMRAAAKAKEPYKNSVKADLFHNKYGNDTRRSHNGRGDNYDLAVRTRYTSVNLFSYFYRGTIEFRSKEASLDHNDMFEWIDFCYKVIRGLPRISNNEARREIRNLQDLLARIEKK